MILSVIIPCFNEKNTIKQIILAVKNSSYKNQEIIIVDDFSNDGTTSLLKNFVYKKVHIIVHHEKNLGKGAAIKSAKSLVTGDVIIIQDADLEYDPKDYYNLIKPIQDNQYKVVYGSRVLGRNRYLQDNFTSLYRIFFNHFLTVLSNLLNKQSLTDAHTCYKVFSRDIFDSINLEENDFSFCPEVTTKLALKNINIKEVPINYYGRDYKEGKKIKAFDGLKAIFVLIKYRFFSR
jgi:glycosyltransferase involved in cell wall biosynthesis